MEKIGTVGSFCLKKSKNLVVFTIVCFWLSGTGGGLLLKFVGSVMKFCKTLMKAREGPTASVGAFQETLGAMCGQSACRNAEGLSC